MSWRELAQKVVFPVVGAAVIWVIKEGKEGGKCLGAEKMPREVNVTLVRQ